MITTKIIRDIEGFRQLRAEWTELLEASSSACLFLTWEWMFTWWQHLSGKNALYIILVRRNGVLIALAPLSLCPSRFLPNLPFRMLEFIASNCCVGSDYLSIVVRRGEEKESLRILADCLGQANHVMEFVRVEKASYLMVSLVLQLRHAGWESISFGTNHCPYADLSQHDWNSYLHTLTGSHRSDVTKKLKRLQSDFEVAFVPATTEAARQVAMDTLIRLHVERWSQHGGSNAFNKPELVAFHQAISRLCLECGWLRMHTLTLNEVPAASLYVFNYNGVYYYYQAAFNVDYAKFSVGMLALALCIKGAIDDKASQFDFLHDDEEYKYLWAREERELVRLELFPPRNKGKICRQAVLMKSSLKRLLGHFQ